MATTRWDDRSRVLILVQGDSVWTYKWIVDVMLGGILGVGSTFIFQVVPGAGSPALSLP